MRTYLTRLTLSAAGVVLAGFGAATTAHASDEDLSIIDESPLYLEESQILRPVDTCEIDFTIEECGLPVGEEPKPVFTPDPGLMSPGVLGGTDDDSGAGGSEDGESDPPEGGESDPSEGEGSEEPGGPDGGEGSGSGGAGGATGEPGSAEGASESGDGSQGAEPDPSGDPADGGGETSSSGPVSENPANEPTPDSVGPTADSDENTAAPSVQSASGDGGSPDLLFAVLIAALAAFGLGSIGVGLGRRRQSARSLGR